MLSRYLLAALALLASLGTARADSTVAAMTAASALTGPELFYCVQGGADRKCTTTQIQTFAAGLTVGTTPITGGVSGNFLTISAGVLGSSTPAVATAALSPFSTSTTAQGVVPGSNGAGATSFLNATGVWSVPAAGSGITVGTTTVSGTCTSGFNLYNNAGVVGCQANGGGSGTPGGSTTQMQYNNAGAFGGISNVTSNGTSLTEASLNVSGSSSTYVLHGSAFTSTGININGSGNVILGGDGGGQSVQIQSGILVRGGTGNAMLASMDNAGGQRSAALWEVGTVNTSGIFEQRFTTIPQTYRLYNTFTDVNNWERGVIDWTTTANMLTIGVQNLGTGSPNRQMRIQAGDIIFFNSAGVDAVQIASNQLTVRSNLLIFNTSGDASMWRVAAKVLQFGDGLQNANGWMQWAGQSRVTADVNFTTTTLNPVTGLSVNVQAGRTYVFDAELSYTDAAAGGIRAAIAGTATATNIIYDGWIVDSGANGIKGNAQATALGTAVANAATTGTAGHVVIRGTITVNAAGTLLVQAAQSVSNATATTVKQGSYFYVYDNP